MNLRLVRVAGLNVNVTSYNAAANLLEHLRFMGPFRYYLLVFVLLFGMKSLPYEHFRIKEDSAYELSQCGVVESEGRIRSCVCEGNEEKGAGDGNHRGDDFVADDSNGVNVEKNNNGPAWREMIGVDKASAAQLMVVKQDTLLPVKDFVNNSPVPHLSDGFALTRIVPNTEFLGLMKFCWIWYGDSLRSSSTRPSTVKHAWTREFEIKLKDDSLVQFDGELIPLKHYYGKVHKGVVKVFGTGTIRGHPHLVGDYTVCKVRVKVFLFLCGVFVWIVGFGLAIYWLMARVFR